MVRQRTLSPLLFNVFINGIVVKVKESGVGEEAVSVLLFADDMVLPANSEENLGHLVAKVKDFCDEWLMEVNVDKTKLMVVSKEGKDVAKEMAKYSSLNWNVSQNFPI